MIELRWTDFVWLTCLSVLAVGCGSDASTPEEFPIRFIATTGGAPLAGARFGAGGVDLGVTDEAGHLDVVLSGTEGDVVPTRVACPSGYREPDALPPLTLHHMRRLDERSQSRRLRLRVECRPEQRTAMLLVRAHSARAEALFDLPVLVDGLEVARTDADGLAHVELRYPPHTSFEVALGTDHLPSLLPRNPSRRLTMPDAEEVFAIDQELVEATPERVGRARRHGGRSGPRLPQKLVAGQNAPTDTR
jgi:hypothetical protein